MITIEKIRSFALQLRDTDEHPHFDKTAFRVRKKIFFTMNDTEQRICVQLDPMMQNIFKSFNDKLIHPVPNKWGKHGWTLVYYKQLKKAMVEDIITCAYCHVAPEELSKLYQKE